MDISRYKKKKQGVDSKAWADWLSDDLPEPGAPQPIREVRPVTPMAAKPAFRRPPTPVSKLQPQAPKPVAKVAPQASPNAPTPAQIRTVQATASPITGSTWQQVHKSAVSRPAVAPQRQRPEIRKVPAFSKAEQPLPWHQPKTEPVAQKPQEATGQPAVSISINIPSFDRKKLQAALKKRRRIVRAAYERNRKRVLVSTGVTTLVLLGLFAPPLLKFGRNLVQTKQPASAPAASKLGYAKPPFDVVVPSTKQGLATPDGTHSAYDAKKQSYSFIDNIDGKQITVSQQQIPAGETADSIVPKAAKSFNATNPLKTGWGTAYIQTNQKYNSQVVVFGVKGVLMFIQSSFVLTNDQWVKYINALN